MKVKLIAWIAILLMTLIAATWALFNVKPTETMDCKKAMEAWNYDEGQAAIAAFKGEDMKAQLLKSNYTRLVTGMNKPCFPPKLVEYIKQG